MKNNFVKRHIGILTSLLVHMGLLALLYVAPTITPPTPNIVYLDLVTQPDAAELAKAKAAEETKPVQIVEQDVTNQKEAPKNAKYLSASNQTVEKETVASKRGQFKNSKQAPGPQQDASSSLFKTYGVQALENKMKALADSQTKFEESEDGEFKNDKKAEKTGETLDKQALNKNSGSRNPGEESQTQDYVKNKDLGLETLMNTREFKYYSYYNRIRKQLAQHWEDKVREKLVKIFKQGRSPAATAQDRITKLMIVLNEQGTLVKVQIVRDSGITDLDDAAVEAFRAAAPFPNPPKGIVEGDGTVKIRWDFVLET